MWVLWAVTAAALLGSLIASRRRTLVAVIMAAKRLAKVLPAFLLMLCLLAVTLTLVPAESVQRWLGADSGMAGVAAAAVAGSITLMPGFIAFPLAAALRGQGVPYVVLATFTTTLMMVGVLTFPLERQYFGTRVAIARNLIGLGICLVVAAAIGLAFGELRP